MTEEEEQGHFRAYRPMTLRSSSLEQLHVINQIIAQYEAAGLAMTLRQLYYQLVTRNIIANNDSEYGKLGRLVNQGRLQGLVSWTAIEDRNRSLQGLPTQKSPERAIERVARSYRRDLWANQEWRPEVWIEKDALSGVIQGVCNRHRVDFFACRGNVSQSEMWRAGQRLARYIEKGQRPIVFHLGDHDPSGLDMTRDNTERLTLFAGVPVMLVRLALNMDQIEELKPPPNPVKKSDNKWREYCDRYDTTSSWELDALEPSFIDRLIHENVDRLKDRTLWDDDLRREVDERQYLADIADIDLEDGSDNIGDDHD